MERPCYACGESASDPKGTIYVPRQVGGRWRNVPICTYCWSREEPNREPVRLRE